MKIFAKVLTELLLKERNSAKKKKIKSETKEAAVDAGATLDRVEEVCGMHWNCQSIIELRLSQVYTKDKKGDMKKICSLVKR
jgi:hypothetical protein